mgnify:CR=1 FL=1
MIPWTKKYSPKNTKEILGHELAVDKIKKNLYGKKKNTLTRSYWNWKDNIGSRFS